MSEVGSAASGVHFRTIPRGRAAPNWTTVIEITDRWRPFRMWALVLLHVWFRSEAGGSLRHRR